MTVHTPSNTGLPDFPITCLKTADQRSTATAFQGQNTVIDFWTTRCTRCPDALDKLDAMKSEAKYSNVEFVSVCCDKLDGAREIIEKDDRPRWDNVAHYFMDENTKEEAKQVLGFASVPFYVVVNEDGEIVQKGNSKQIDFEAIPGINRPEIQKENIAMPSTGKFTENSLEEQPALQQPVVEHVFCLDEDF
mmetsp:Transcript_8066/g.11569  ORF Transcript_8066/g.11569 Transcript_8066/m.11569 type:complete len:191 (+) Transcript_8066:55-627(+)